MGELKVVTSLKNIEVYRDEDPKEQKGHVDVRLQLFEGTPENKEGKIICVLNVRSYFQREDLPVATLVDEALLQAHRAVLKMGEHLKSAPPSEGLEGLWSE